MSRRSSKRKAPEPQRILPTGPAAQLFIHDPYDGGNIYDAEPFCTYALAGVDGEVDYGYHRRVAIPLLQFGDPQQFERALLRMLLAVAQHTRRFLTIVPSDAHYFVNGDRRFAGPRAKKLYPSVKDALDAPGLPGGVILGVTRIEPELFGRVIVGWDHQYGAALFAPYSVSAVEVVPIPWGHIQNPAHERLPPID